MLKLRVIPCLDVDRGRVVKGVNFVSLRDAGDPVEQAALYDAAGADELCFLDITASHENRDTILEVVGRTAARVFLPLTVGGGVRSTEDMRRLLLAGADKCSMNSAAVARPELVREAARKFGSQCVVVAVDAKRAATGWEVFTHGGRRGTGIDAIDWCRRVAELGAGEILLTSMDRDGTGQGFDLDLLRAACAAVRVPVMRFCDSVCARESDACTGSCPAISVPSAHTNSSAIALLTKNLILTDVHLPDFIIAYL